MAVRSTVGLQRDLLRRVDAWAAGHNLPVGPGHRALAVSELLEIALAQKPVPRQVTLATEGKPEHTCYRGCPPTHDCPACAVITAERVSGKPGGGP